MKIQFSGKKLSKIKDYPNLYMDSVIPKKGLKSASFQSFLKKRLKELNYKKHINTTCYAIVVQDDAFNIARISNMINYRRLAKVFGVTDIEFLHNYLTHNTGTGKLGFPSGSFEEIKKIYAK